MMFAYLVFEFGNGVTLGLASLALGDCESFAKVWRTRAKSVKSYNMDGSNYVTTVVSDILQFFLIVLN